MSDLDLDASDLTLPTERVCGYSLVDPVSGEDYPCDRPGVSWRWYQSVEHEDMLDRACELHENRGGIRMAALVAEVRALRAKVGEARTDVGYGHLEAGILIMCYPQTCGLPEAEHGRFVRTVTQSPWVREDES